MADDAFFNLSSMENIVRLSLQTVLVLCAIAAGIGAVVGPGIPEIAIVLGVAIGSVYWLQKAKHRETTQASDSNVLGS